MNRRIITFVSLAILMILAVGQLFTAERWFSKLENRYLETLPEANVESISNGEWMEQLETYLADHVPGRDEWVQLKNTVVRLSGRKQIGKVVFAENDRLIQTENVTLERLEENVKLIASLEEALPDKIQLDLLVAPNASWVYKDLLPEETPIYDQEKAVEIIQEFLSDRVNVVVPIESLMNHKDEAIYFRTDHHWTMRGAAYAFVELAETMGIKTDPFAYETQIMGQNFLGSIYSQAPVYGYEGEEFEVFQVPGLDVQWSSGEKSGKVLIKENFQEKDQYTAFFGGNYGLVRIENEKARSSEKLLILKDSYANILIPFLIEEYSEIVMVDLRYYNGSVKTLVQDEGVERVLAVYNLDFLCTDRSFAWMGV